MSNEMKSIMAKRVSGNNAVQTGRPFSNAKTAIDSVSFRTLTPVDNVDPDADVEKELRETAITGAKIKSFDDFNEALMLMEKDPELFRIQSDRRHIFEKVREAPPDLNIFKHLDSHLVSYKGRLMTKLDYVITLFRNNETDILTNLVILQKAVLVFRSLNISLGSSSGAILRTESEQAFLKSKYPDAAVNSAHVEGRAADIVSYLAHKSNVNWLQTKKTILQ